MIKVEVVFVYVCKTCYLNSILHYIYIKKKMIMIFLLALFTSDVLCIARASASKLTSVSGFSVTNPAFTGDTKIYSTRSSNLDNLNPYKTPPTVSFKTSSKIDNDYTVLRLNKSDGTPSRTIILPKMNDSDVSILPRLPWKEVPAFGRVKPTRSYIRSPFNRTKIFNPPENKKTPIDNQGFFDDPDDNYVLISDSSHPIPTQAPLYTSSVTTPPYLSPTHQVLASTTELPQRKYKIKRRKYRKNTTSLFAGHYPRPNMNGQSVNPTSLKSSYADQSKAKFLNLFTIIQFPNDACSEDGGSCYHELECTGLGGIPTQRCARGYGVCCMIEATCGARTNINNTVFVGSENTMGSCTLSIDKVPCTKQIRLDFLDFNLEPPMDGECVKDRLFISGANRNVFIPVLCGSLSGQHIYLDVDEVPGPVVLNLISTRPIFRIKVSQICDGNPMLAPKSCLQYHTGRTGSIRSFNYVPASATSSYLNNLNYAICIGKEPDSCSIMYSNETPDGEFEFDIVNLDQDGALSVPPRQAGAEVFNCPDDFIAVSSVRLCGQKFNDGSVQVDFTRNYPVTDTTRGPYIVAVRSDEAHVGKGFFLNYEQKAC